MPVIIFSIIFLCSFVFAQVQGETPALTPFAGEIGTHLIAMPTYTYSRIPGTLGLRAEEETWLTGKWKDRQIFNRFVPIMNWEATRQNSIWFYAGNEIGDELWQELLAPNGSPNRTPMLYGGFSTPPVNGFYAMAEFNQIDHLGDATLNIRSQRINSQKFSWFGDNLPAYSGLFGGFGYSNNGDFFKDASVLAGSEYLWAWNKDEWIPIRISPRVEGNANFYFMKNEIELYASAEKFQIKDSTAENRNNLGLRLKGKNTGGGFYASRTEDNENVIIWTDFNHSFFGFANEGFVVFNAWQNQEIKFEDIYFADSLEYKINLAENTYLTPGFLLNQDGIKLYAEMVYKFKPIFARTRAYQNYTVDFESIGFDSEISYKSSLAEAGLAYSREFFEYYREHIFYSIKPAEEFGKIFLKYRFLEDLTLTHEWIYRSKILVPSIPATWFWNAQLVQKVSKLNTSFYAIWLNVLSKDNKDFSFGGINRTRFFCGFNTEL